MKHSSTGNLTILGVASVALLFSLTACTPAPQPPATPRTAHVGAAVWCTILTNGVLKCQGVSPGDGSSGSAGWVPVSGITHATSVSSGGRAYPEGLINLPKYFRCAVDGGAVKCWGDNSHGQLGTGTGVSSLAPVVVSGLGSGAAEVASSVGTTCARTSAGGVKCWGDLSLDGASEDQASTPVDVAGLTSGVQGIDVGGHHACAVTTTGGVKCWGRLLDPSDVPIVDFGTTPVDVTGATSGIAAAASGSNHTCALTSAGGVKCWGSNANGQLGNTDDPGTVPVDSATPVDVFGLTSGVVAVAASGNTSCALKADGTMWAWGLHWGQVPRDVSPLLPFNGTTVPKVTAIDCGAAITTDGEFVFLPF